MNDLAHPTDKWMEPGRLGEFASGTVSGIRTRGYRSLLLAEAGRLVLVNGFNAPVEFDGETRPLAMNGYPLLRPLQCANQNIQECSGECEC